MKPESVDSVISDIRQEQGLKSGEKIDTTKVSPTNLESLGDSVMEEMIGSSEIHDQMDERMGGDDSASLNRQIGYNYLVTEHPGGIMGFLGSGMMLDYHPGIDGTFGLGGILIGILLSILTFIIIMIIIRAIRKRNPKLVTEEPLDILKRRYSKGEITDAEFEKMKQNLNI